MRQIRSFADRRHAERCAYCGGGGVRTRDHVPSKVLLDAPLPENLPVVPACAACNASFAADEEYVACLIECARAGSTDPDALARANIGRILSERPALRARLEKGWTTQSGRWRRLSAEEARVRKIVLKLARGHAAYELGEPQRDKPNSLNFMPIDSMTRDQRTAFETVPVSSIWPEVGSRAMQRVAGGECGWMAVQEGRYRFVAAAGGRAIVRMVLSDYLACEVIWN
jgi:hypothetical protein